MRARLAACLLMMMCSPVLQAEARIAVASNFRAAAEALAQARVAAGAAPVALVFGATGKHFAQIVNGAPFDALLAADAARPIELERRGLVQPDSRFTYARGRLVLWSADRKMVDADGNVLRDPAFSRLAIANPRLAPYGLAAIEVLHALGIESRVQDRLVIGENISQAYQFVHSGNADIGLVALAQVAGHSEGSRWPVPDRMHQPILQQAVLLTDSPGARAFLAFMQDAAGRRIIKQHGYGVDSGD